MVGARRAPRIERDRELVGKRFCGGLDDSIFGRHVKARAHLKKHSGSLLRQPIGIGNGSAQWVVCKPIIHVDRSAREIPQPRHVDHHRNDRKCIHIFNCWKDVTPGRHTNPTTKDAREQSPI